MIITNNPVFQPLSNIPINHTRLINGLFEEIQSVSCHWINLDGLMDVILLKIRNALCRYFREEMSFIQASCSWKKQNFEYFVKNRAVNFQINVLVSANGTNMTITCLSFNFNKVENLGTFSSVGYFNTGTL